MTFRRSTRSPIGCARKRQLAAVTARVLCTIFRRNRNKAGEETALIPDVEYDPYEDQELTIQQWRVDQLWRLGVPRLLAAEFACGVDWHDVAALVRRGCPPLLALEIAR